MAYPPAPWQMHGQLFCSLFRVRGGDAHHPAGLYGVALVAYETPSPLTYSELLVARPVRDDDGRAVEITDIWVDSPDSRDGGRELWAIPKELAAFTRTSTGNVVQRTSWTTSIDARPVVEARFTDVSRAGVRLPFRGRTRQQRAGVPAGDPGAREAVAVCAAMTGTTKALPCKASWSFDVGGPLAWLAGERPLASVRMADFSMSFG